MEAGPNDLEEVRFDTTTPEETIGNAIAFFKTQTVKHPLAAIEIGSFGSIDLDKRSPTYGYITATPKLNWSQTDLLSPFRQAFNIASDLIQM